MATASSRDICTDLPRTVTVTQGLAQLVPEKSTSTPLMAMVLPLAMLQAGSPVMFSKVQSQVLSSTHGAYHGPLGGRQAHQRSQNSLKSLFHGFLLMLKW